MHKLLITTLVFCSLNSFAFEPKERWGGFMFRPISTLSAVPIAIRQQLGTDAPGLYGVADKNRLFNATDVVDKPLPMRRFLAAGNDGNAWLVALENGGRGYNIQVYLFSNNVEWQHCVLLASPKTLQEVIKLLPPVCPPSKNGG